MPSAGSGPSAAPASLPPAHSASSGTADPHRRALGTRWPGSGTPHWRPPSSSSDAGTPPSGGPGRSRSPPPSPPAESPKGSARPAPDHRAAVLPPADTTRSRPNAGCPAASVRDGHSTSCVRPPARPSRAPPPSLPPCSGSWPPASESFSQHQVLLDHFRDNPALRQLRTKPLDPLGFLRPPVIRSFPSGDRAAEDARWRWPAAPL